MNQQPYSTASIEMLPDALMTPQHQGQYHNAVVTLGQSPLHTTVSAQHHNVSHEQSPHHSTVASQHHDLTVTHSHSPHQSTIASTHHDTTTVHSQSPHHNTQSQHLETTTLHHQNAHHSCPRQLHAAPVVHSQNSQLTLPLPSQHHDNNQLPVTQTPQEATPTTSQQHIAMLSHGQNTHQTVLDQQSDSIDKTMLETSSPSRDMEEVEEIEEDQASGDGTARHCHTKKSPEQSDDEIKIEYDEEETREELPKKRTRKGRTKSKKKVRSKRSIPAGEVQVETSLTAFMRKRRQDLTLGAKVKVLEMLDMEPKVPQGKIANMFRVSQSQVSRIMKNKDAIMGQWNRFATPDRKRCRLGKAGALEQKLVDWYKQAKKEDLPISGPILMEKAKSIGNEMGIDFKPSAGWLGRWKDRNGVTLKRFKDKDGAPSITKVGNHWRRYLFAKATKEVPLQNVWVIDETVILYNSVPDFMTQGNIGETDRMSVILASNLAGTERRPAAVVGRVQLTGSATLPCPFHYHPKGAITLEFFSAWLREWDRELRSKKKKIVILLNKTAHHPENLPLFNINVTFFPPGTASVLQPFRLGIINIFKALYRHQQLKHIMSKIQANEHLAHASMFNHSVINPPTLSHGTSALDAVFMIHKAWRHVSPETIVKGVVKAGLSKDVDALNVNDQVGPPPGVSQQEFEIFTNSDADLDTGDSEEGQDGKGNSQSGMITNTVQYPHYSNMFNASNAKAQQPNQHVEMPVENIPALPKVSEAVIACQVIRQYLQRRGGHLFDEFSVLESAIHVDMMLESRPDLQNEPMTDPLHDSSSVHSMEAHQRAHDQKLDYIQKVQDELHQQKLQKEMKKNTQTSAAQNSQSSISTPTQDLRNDLHNQLIEIHKHDMHSQDMAARQEMARHDLHQQPQMQRTDLVRQELIRPEYRHEVHQDNNRPRTSLVELRTVNATFRTGMPSDGRNENRIDLKNDAMPVVPGDVRNLPGVGDLRGNGSELHHPGLGPELTQNLRHDNRMENPGVPYYTIPNTLHHYMQPK